MMDIKFGREICGNLATAESREWLVTNGIGGYACGTVAGILTRRYHGLLIAALKPPVERVLLLSKLDELVCYNEQSYPLYVNRWADGSVNPNGFINIESFYLEGTTPVWNFALADALLEKRIWIQSGENTTYIRYTLLRGSKPLTLSLKALVNYRDHHGNTNGDRWQMQIDSLQRGICVRAFPDAVPYYLLAIQASSPSYSAVRRTGLTRCGTKFRTQPLRSLLGLRQDNLSWQTHHTWYKNFALAVETYRGLLDSEDHLHAATLNTVLQVGESVTLVASTESEPLLDSQAAWQARYDYEQQLLNRWHSGSSFSSSDAPSWLEQLVLAADQFIVDRPLAEEPEGKTIIAGYPWFTDWGRDTMISLPGLTISTGRLEIARIILRTFAKYVDRGMLPNVFPDAGEKPDYNTVDATLWYFEAIGAYYAVTQDQELLTDLFPLLAEIVDWHRRGTRYQIHLDDDGLIYAGEKGVQLTWMDAKVDDWVVTPRIGKPVEINALWYNALVCMVQFARALDRPSQAYEQMAVKTREGFQRFWHEAAGYCYDVIDTPEGNDLSLRPNQIFSVSLPIREQKSFSPLLERQQQKSVVDTVARYLLTSHGLRSLAPNHPDYQGHYGGTRLRRDGAYHQGTVWGWLIGHFVQAHLKVYQNPILARSFIEPMVNHLQASCVGKIGEIFDGDAPFLPRGCFAQAWSVAEVLRGWLLTHKGS